MSFSVRYALGLPLITGVGLLAFMPLNAADDDDDLELEDDEQNNNLPAVVAGCAIAPTLIGTGYALTQTPQWTIGTPSKNLSFALSWQSLLLLPPAFRLSQDLLGPMFSAATGSGNNKNDKNKNNAVRRRDVARLKVRESTLTQLGVFAPTQLIMASQLSSDSLNLIPITTAVFMTGQMLQGDKQRPWLRIFGTSLSWATALTSLAVAVSTASTVTLAEY